MSRLWPKNMAGQIALLVAAALLVAQAINFALVYRESGRRELAQVSAPAIARLADAIDRDAAGAGISPTRIERTARRGVFVQQGNLTRGSSRVRNDVAERARSAFAEGGLHVLQVRAAETDAAAVQRAGKFTRVRAAIERKDRRRYLVISAEVSPGKWISAGARLPKRDPQFIGWLLLQTLITYGLVLAAVLWSVRRIGRPLTQLTGAVEGFRSAEKSVPVAESGPSDVRRLIAAYNGMRTRIAGLLDEKDRMLGAIGHDLRTPLASLRVRTEGMEDDSERERMVATIEEMNQTLDDILSLARLGRPSEQETKVDLAALLDQIVDDFQELGADVSLREAQRTAVTLRPTLVTRALRNLIDNAVKYGDAATVGIVREGDGVCVTIDDRGPGIPDDSIDAMFEPFTRLEQSRSRETGGSGLGLALAKAIVLQHGGRLTLRNRPEGGLRAALWLPAR